jgi:NADH dehydrogenase FAD-containing subunit
MRTVILGAGYAGMTAAIRLARRARGRVRVTLVNATDCFVERIRLHERAAGRLPRRRSIASLLRGTGVTLVVGQASAVDVDSRVVTVAGERLPWDRLVLALGSRPDMTTPGAREHALGLDADGAATLAARMPGLAACGGRVLVVGGGLTGLEAATELAESWPGLRVTMVTRGDAGSGFSDGARRHFGRVCARLGISVIADTSVTRVEPGCLATAREIVPFDECVWAVGFVAAPLPSGLKLARNHRGQVLVDPFLRAIDNPAIHIAGDLAI